MFYTTKLNKIIAMKLIDFIQGKKMDLTKLKKYIYSVLFLSKKWKYEAMKKIERINREQANNQSNQIRIIKTSKETGDYFLLIYFAKSASRGEKNLSRKQIVKVNNKS